MTDIVLTAEQSAILEKAGDLFRMRDPSGKSLGFFGPTLAPPNLTEPEIIEECKRRLASNQRRIPSSEVLKGLDEMMKAKQS